MLQPLKLQTDFQAPELQSYDKRDATVGTAAQANCESHLFNIIVTLTGH